MLCLGLQKRLWETLHKTLTLTHTQNRQIRQLKTTAAAARKAPRNVCGMAWPWPGTGDREIDSAPYLTLCLAYDFHASIELVLQLPSYAAN